MGRKAAPQPLALSGPGGSRSHDSSVSSTEFETAPSTTSSTSPPASSLTSRFAHKRPQTATAKSSPPVSNFEAIQQIQQIRRLSPDPRDTSRRDMNPPPPPLTASATVDQLPTDSKKTKGAFFHFNKPSKSSNQLSSHTYNSSESRSQMSSRGRDGPSRPNHAGVPAAAESSYEDRAQQAPSQDDLSLSPNSRRTPTANFDARRAKAKSLGILGRTKSGRGKDYQGLSQTADPMPPPINVNNLQGHGQPLKSAGASQDRSFREMMDSSGRNRSEDRAPKQETGPTRGPPPASREGRSAFLSGLRNSSTKAAGMLSKSLFGGRSERAPERDHHLDDEHYEISVINLPLVAQTRKTRISKRLEESRDKTEFWMPALPWRAIDYLNYKGCEVEGLYRVPGSGPQIKKYQRKFDELRDVNLFEEEDLYDINVVGSMLKAWLRELPDELFPKAAQERISRECAGAQEVPQMLIDELSNLSPFQYYLLFAITCHLSLLLAHSDKNKMDFRNLCICFQPCIKIDAFCFRFLVCDWKDCWRGCKNEPQYIEQEYALFEQPPPNVYSDKRATPRDTPEPAIDSTGKLKSSREEPTTSQAPNSPFSAKSVPSTTAPITPQESIDKAEEPALEEAQPSPSPNSSKLSFHSAEHPPPKVRRKPLPVSTSKDSMGSKGSTVSTAMTSNSDRDPPKVSVDLRRLSPIQPLSPLGF